MFVLGETEKAKSDEVKHECLVSRVRYKYHSLSMLGNFLISVDENIEFSRTEERKMERKYVENGALGAIRPLGNAFLCCLDFQMPKQFLFLASRDSFQITVFAK